MVMGSLGSKKWKRDIDVSRKMGTWIRRVIFIKRQLCENVRVHFVN
jgi:hypothetical protein